MSNIITPEDIARMTEVAEKAKQSGGYANDPDAWIALKSAFTPDRCLALLSAFSRQAERPREVEGATTIEIPLDVARWIYAAFLPLNPNKLRNSPPDLIAAAHVFKRAVEAHGDPRALLNAPPASGES